MREKKIKNREKYHHPDSIVELVTCCHVINRSSGEKGSTSNLPLHYPTPKPNMGTPKKASAWTRRSGPARMEAVVQDKPPAIVALLLLKLLIIVHRVTMFYRMPSTTATEYLHWNKYSVVLVVVVVECVGGVVWGVQAVCCWWWWWSSWRRLYTRSVLPWHSRRQLDGVQRGVMALPPRSLREYFMGKILAVLVVWEGGHRRRRRFQRWRRINTVLH